MALAALASIPDVAAVIHRSVSGQELITGGYHEDVKLASQSGISPIVPVLTSDAFTAA